MIFSTMAKGARGIALVLCVSAAASCTANMAGPASTDAAAQYTDYFADNGLGNAVAVVQHPAGEYLNGITYVSYQGPLEDPYVATYNHETDEWFGPFQAGISELGRMPLSEGRIDNHGKPTLIIDDEGYIHIFYGGHGGSARDGVNPLGNVHNGRNRHAVSARPYDITEWVDLDNIPPFGTYNQAIKMDNGDMYIFYRHGAHRSDWVYHKSTDNGRTFGEAVSFLGHRRRDDLQAVDSWYPFVRRGEGDEIIVSFDYHLCWDSAGAPDERGHTANRQDLFYMTFDTSTGDWHNIEGEQLPMPLYRQDAEEMTLVGRSNGLWSFNGSVALDPLGRPNIGITMGEDIGEKAGGPKHMRHFRWTGEEWVGGHPNTMPIGNGDLEAPTADSVRFLLSSRDSEGDGIVSWWHSNNGGQSFEQGETLLERPNSSFATSAFIRNAHPDARVIVAERPPGTNDRRMYLLGDNGPVRRQR